MAREGTVNTSPGVDGSESRVIPRWSIAMRLNWRVLAILGLLGGLATSEAHAQWGPLGRGPLGPRYYRRGYGVVYAPPTVVTAYPYVVSETRYVYTAPTVVTTEVVQPAPVVERRVVQPPPVVERRIVQPPPVVESRVVQPPPVVERRVVQPPPVEEDRVIQPPATVETRIVQPPPPAPY